MAGKRCVVRFYGMRRSGPWIPGDGGELLGTITDVYDIRVEGGWLVCTCSQSGQIRWICIPGATQTIAVDVVD